MQETGLEGICPYLPMELRTGIERMPFSMQGQIRELRLRGEKPVGILCGENREQFLCREGRVSDNPVEGIRLARGDLMQIFSAFCEYSVYRHTREICQGFLTIPGGFRIGIAGSFVERETGSDGIRDISGLAIRIPRGMTGCGETLYRQTCIPSPKSLLLVGGVGCGKTTMLRDLCRILGQRYRVGLVDERGELAAMHGGIPGFDVGLHTDVLDGFPRAKGLVTALRVLTPEALVCDEISTEADAEAVLQVTGCGVPLLASAHGGTPEEVRRRPLLRNLLQQGAFAYVAFLSRDPVGQVERLLEGKELL